MVKLLFLCNFFMRFYIEAVIKKKVKHVYKKQSYYISV